MSSRWGVHVNYPDLDLEASSYASSFHSSLYPGRRIPDLCGLTGRSVTIAGGRYAPSLMLPVQPGSSLDSITPSTGADDDGWGIFSGTSAACPQVAGVAALVLAADPNLTPAEVRDVLVRTARNVTTGSSAMGDAAGPGSDDATGAGLVDAARATFWIVIGRVIARYIPDTIKKPPLEGVKPIEFESGRTRRVSGSLVDSIVGAFEDA
jgi:serine protease AprX